MLAGEGTKQIKMLYDASQDESSESFWGTYNTLNKLDELEAESRKRGINIIDNTEEYMLLAQELGLTENQLDVKLYADKDLNSGYSHKEQSEIGINLVVSKDNETETDKEKLKDSTEIRTTTAHELAHQMDKTNTTTDDRETFAHTAGG